MHAVSSIIMSLLLKFTVIGILFKIAFILHLKKQTLNLVHYAQQLAKKIYSKIKSDKCVCYNGSIELLVSLQ